MIIVIGADGYLGWPCVCELASAGYEVVAVDNLLKRKIADDMAISPLIEPLSFQERAWFWNESSNNKINCIYGDLTDWDFTSNFFDLYGKKIDTIIHFAEQPSAPYSMMSPQAGALTVRNNVIGTLNLINAVKLFSPDAHIIKLGTMGEYGTPNIDIEEGWLEVNHKGRTQKFLYPRAAGSIYHTSKVMDTDLLWFSARIWGLTITDLMQGPVYGLNTKLLIDSPSQNTFFWYDEIFGTVINRFITQAIASYPLTVYGAGGQTRGYININDSINCIHHALMHRPKFGELRIFNQMTETFSVLELANNIMDVGNSLGLNVEINNILNPRKESENHYYNPTYVGLKELGVTPTKLSKSVIKEMFEKLIPFKERINNKNFLMNIKWHK